MEGLGRSRGTWAGQRSFVAGTVFGMSIAAMPWAKKDIVMSKQKRNANAEGLRAGATLVNWAAFEEMGVEARIEVPFPEI